MIYLDNAATTYPKPKEVTETYRQWGCEKCVNAGRGSYRLAAQAEQQIRETRGKLAEYVHALSEEDVYFTASATMAANVILQGFSWKSGDVVVVSPYEHNAVMRTLHAMEERYGIQIKVLPVRADGQIDLKKTEVLFELEQPRLVCVTQVSNVTGYLLPYEDIFQEAKKTGAMTFLDSAQGLGICPVHVIKEKIDFLIFAGHKNLYGMFGTGGFVNAGQFPLQPLYFGGTGSDSRNLALPEKGSSRFEVGSPDIASIAALGSAVELTQASAEKDLLHERQLLEILRKGLSEIDGVTLIGTQPLEKSTGILSFVCDRYRSEELGIILDEDFDIAVRTGYHCAPLVHDLIGSVEYGGTVRVSMGRFTTERDVQALVEAVKELMEE